MRYAVCRSSAGPGVPDQGVAWWGCCPGRPGL